MARCAILRRAVVASVLVAAVSFLFFLAGNKLLAANSAEKATAAKELVEEALCREIYGLQEDRDKLLREAREIKPDYAPALWHLGYVRFQNEWVPAEVVPQYAGRDKARTEYEKVRVEQPDTVSGNLTIANWCRSKELFDEERAHLSRVIDLEPDHRAARSRLGFLRREGRWIESADLVEQEQRIREARRAMAKWCPVIEGLREDLQLRSEKRRAIAADEICRVNDPGAIDAMESLLSTQSEEMAEMVLESLSQMPDQRAVESLVRHAVLAPWPKVRERAAMQLGQRKQECYIPLMLAEMYTPIVTRTAVIQTGRGKIGYRHVFAREGHEERQVAALDTEYQRLALENGDGRDTLARILWDAANRSRSRELRVARENRITEEKNQRITEALMLATGQQLGTSPQDWWQWWDQENDIVRQGEKQTRGFQSGTQIAIADQSFLNPDQANPGRLGGLAQVGSHPECFAPGTMVWTSTGQRAIEEIRIGDRVLSQDVETGELTYKPVLRTTIRPMEPLHDVQVGRDHFRTTAGHLFWVSGRGWLRVRELQPGMQMHTVGGAEPAVEVAATAPSAETYNLVVGDFHTYFVGGERVLTHDVTDRRPTSTVVPGLVDR